MYSIYTKKLLAISFSLILGGLIIIYLTQSLWGVAFLILGTAMQVVGWTKIKEEPFSVGLYNVQGERTDVTATGWEMVAKYPPFFIDLDEFVIQRDDYDFTIEDVSAQGGGTVVLTASIKYVPDRGHLKIFADNKGTEGVRNQLFDQFRSLATSFATGAAPYPGKTWVAMRSAGDEFAKAAWKALTGHDMPAVKTTVPTPENAVLSLGINLVEINTTFKGSKPLEDSLASTKAEEQDQAKQRIRFEGQKARAKAIYDALPAIEQSTAKLGAILQMVMDQDAIREGSGLVIKGDPSKAAFAEYATVNRPKGRGNKP